MTRWSKFSVGGLLIISVGWLASWAMCAAPQPAQEALDKIAAIINDNVITYRELQVKVQQAQSEIRRQGVELPPEDVLRRQVLQRMVDTDLQMQLVKSNSITVSSQEVDEAIGQVARRHQLSLDKLKQAIQAQGIPWKTYRSNIHRDIALNKVQQEAVGSITVTEDQVNQAMQSASAKQHLSYHVKDILLPLPEAPTSEQLAERQVLADKLVAALKNGLDFAKAAVRYSSNDVALQGGDLGFRTLTSLPILFAKHVPNMKVGEIRGPLRAPNGYHVIKLEGIGSMGQQHWVTQTHVKQILLKLQPGKSRYALQKQASRIRAQLHQGRTFESLAKQYSEDLNGRGKGGDMGWLYAGQTLPEFEQAYRQLGVGDVSMPVVTSYGVHLIKIVGRRKVNDSLKYQREQLRQALYERKFQEETSRWLQQLRSNAYIKLMV